MSTPKSSSLSDAPPSYSESLSAARPSNPNNSSRISTLIESHILPQLHGKPTTALALIPSNVSTLSLSLSESPFSKTAAPLPFPGESLVGFHSTDNPTIIRLSGSEDTLEYWRKATVVLEVEDQLRQRLGEMGYSVGQGSPKAKAQTLHRIAGSNDVDWKGVERKGLGEGQARVRVQVQEVCLRLENEMSLYETRTGKAIVVKVEIGMVMDMDE